jgi:hypothetical protein
MLDAAMREAYAVKDNEIKAQNTLRVEFYRSYLWRLFLGSTIVKVPNHWSIDYFRANLFLTGHIGITTLKKVVVPFQYTTIDRNRWLYPVTVESCDEVQAGRRTVGRDCEILYLDSASFGGAYAEGIDALIQIYAEKLANCDGAIDVNLLVSRTPWLFEVENDKEAQDMRAVFTRIMSGVPAVYYKRKRHSSDPLEREAPPVQRLPVKDNYVTNDVQDAKRTIINEFLTGIGVNNANTDKRERLITNEVDANNAELFAAVGLWQDNINRQIEKAKSLYGDELANLSVTFARGLNNDTVRPNERVQTQEKQ